jgi:kynureninase
MFRNARIEELRAKSVRLTAYTEKLLKERAARDVQIITPSEPEERGCQLSLRVSGGPRRGRRIFVALGDHGIVCDWREPDIIRIAPTPFYNRFLEVHELVEELAAALKEIA